MERNYLRQVLKFEERILDTLKKNKNKIRVVLTTALLGLVLSTGLLDTAQAEEEKDCVPAVPVFVLPEQEKKDLVATVAALGTQNADLQSTVDSLEATLAALTPTATSSNPVMQTQAAGYATWDAIKTQVFGRETQTAESGNGSGTPTIDFIGTMDARSTSSAEQVVYYATLNAKVAATNDAAKAERVSNSPSQTPSIEPTMTPTAIVQTENEKVAADETQTAVESEFENEPSWSIDFSQLKDGPVPSDLLRIQDGADGDNWSPTWNNERQDYTSNTRNVRIENGKLIIQAHVEPSNGQEYTSARVDTIGTFKFRYGKLEVVAKLPTGIGSFPAIWLLPFGAFDSMPVPNGVDQSADSKYGWRGEIDFETYGILVGKLYATMHTYATNIAGGPSEYQGNTTISPDEFHTFGIEWTEDAFTWTLDGNPFYTVVRTNSDPTEWALANPNQEAILIINYAFLGEGTWVGDMLTSDQLIQYPDGIDAATIDGSTLEVKEIKYYPLKGN